MWNCSGVNCNFPLGRAEDGGSVSVAASVAAPVPFQNAPHVARNVDISHPEHYTLLHCEINVSDENLMELIMTQPSKKTSSAQPTAKLASAVANKAAKNTY